MNRVLPRSKAELSKLRDHIDRLKDASWIGTARRWWPRYLFHCTDLLNVVNILQSGELLSRTQAQLSASLRVDIAAPDIIGRTDAEWHDYVRLYFRPRTPTQYRNEGFRPASELELGAHCPVPVYLVFGAYAVLARRDSLFSDGNLAAGAQPKRTIDELSEMPFELIYHEGRFEPQEGRVIVFHRNAEVLIPQRLGLSNVRHVLCRSQAEYETLRNLLAPRAWDMWAAKVGVVPRLNLFHSRWSFVEQVELADERVLFRFNQATTTPGPFAARVDIGVGSPTGTKRHHWSNEHFEARDAFPLSLNKIGNPTNYSIRLYLDEHLAFQGRHEAHDLPW